MATSLPLVHILILLATERQFLKVRDSSARKCHRTRSVGSFEWRKSSAVWESIVSCRKRGGAMLRRERMHGREHILNTHSDTRKCVCVSLYVSLYIYIHTYARYTCAKSHMHSTEYVLAPICLPSWSSVPSESRANAAVLQLLLHVLAVVQNCPIDFGVCLGPGQPVRLPESCRGYW